MDIIIRMERYRGIGSLSGKMRAEVEVGVVEFYVLVYLRVTQSDGQTALRLLSAARHRHYRVPPSDVEVAQTGNTNSKWGKSSDVHGNGYIYIEPGSMSMMYC